MKTLRILAAVTALPILLLAGCSAGSTAVAPAAGVEYGEYASEDRAANSMPADGSMPEDQPAEVPVAAGQQIARTARVSLTVTDIEAAAAQLRQLASAMSGLITSENLVTGDDIDPERRPVSTMVISVDSAKLDSTLDQLRSVGTITSRVISSEDVTLQVADVSARIKTLEASIARLRELSDKAGSIRELTELEAELANRIAERDSLAAQQRVLSQRVAQSPITIMLTTPPPPGELETAGFLGGLLAGWNALLASSRVLLTVLGAVLPFAALAAVIATPFLVWRHRVRARRTPTATPAPAPESSGSDVSE